MPNLSHFAYFALLAKGEQDLVIGIGFFGITVTRVHCTVVGKAEIAEIELWVFLDSNIHI